jgi:hypothetical protein
MSSNDLPFRPRGGLKRARSPCSPKPGPGSHTKRVRFVSPSPSPSSSAGIDTAASTTTGNAGTVAASISLPFRSTGPSSAFPVAEAASKTLANSNNSQGRAQEDFERQSIVGATSSPAPDFLVASFPATSAAALIPAFAATSIDLPNSDYNSSHEHEEDSGVESASGQDSDVYEFDDDYGDPSDRENDSSSEDGEKDDDDFDVLHEGEDDSGFEGGHEDEFEEEEREDDDDDQDAQENSDGYDEDDGEEDVDYDDGWPRRITTPDAAIAMLNEDASMAAAGDELDQDDEVLGRFDAVRMGRYFVERPEDWHGDDGSEEGD